MDRSTHHELEYPTGLWRAPSSARQILWGMLKEDRAQLAIARSRKSDGADDIVFDQCEEKLEEAERCIDRKRVRPFYFWELIHQVDDLLLLVIPEEFLPARAVEIKALFDKKIEDKTVRAHWLGRDGEKGPLLRTVSWLTGEKPNPAEAQPNQPPAPKSDELARHRLILQGALRAVNKQVNSGFWQLSMNVAVQVWSGLLLVILFALALLFAPHSPLAGWGWLQTARTLLDLEEHDEVFSLILLGAGGAIASNMLSSSSFTFAIGATARYFAYNVFVKPALGGFAALVVYLLDRSGGFLESTPGTANGPKALFTLALLSVAAGFSAERWLRGTMDKTLEKMLRSSEKSSLVGSGAK